MFLVIFLFSGFSCEKLPSQSFILLIFSFDESQLLLWIIFEMLVFLAARGRRILFLLFLAVVVQIGVDLQIFEVIQVLHGLHSYFSFIQSRQHLLLAIIKVFVSLQYLISNYLAIIMKKKLSLLIRRKPVRRVMKTQHINDSPLKEREECASAKKYLFSLDEEQEALKNVSIISQFKSNRKEADVSISKWSPENKQRQRQNWFEICTSKSLALEKKHLQFQSTHEDSYQNQTQRRNNHVKKISNTQKTPKLHGIKFFRKKNMAQNLSQSQFTSFTQKLPSDLNQFSTSIKTNDLKTLQLKLKLQKTREAYPTTTLGVSFFDLSLNQISILRNKTEKNYLHTNKTNDGCISPSQTVQRFGKNMIMNEQAQRAQKKKKFDIIFVRHKLRRQQGLWMGEDKWRKDVIPVASRRWEPKNKDK